MSGLPVLIIGAGISGLILAQHLQQLGVPFEIFEREESISARSGGWGLTLHWALPALRQLVPAHIVARFPETFVNKQASARGDVGRFPLFDLQSGSALDDVPADERIRVNRVRLRQLLAEDIKVQWCKSLRDIQSSDSSVTAYFEDGTSCKGRLLVGCDGSRSRTRQILYPDHHEMNLLPVRILGATAEYSAAEIKDIQRIDPFMFKGCHPPSDVFLFFSFLDTPDNFEDNTNKYHGQLIISWADTKNIPVPDSSSSRLALMKQLAADWAEPFRSLVQDLSENIQPRSIVVEDYLFRPGQTAHPLVVLMGDSAHTMTMYRGEGANNAIMDVLDFVKRVDVRSDSFVADSLRTSLAVYEKDIFGRAEASVLNSRQACLDAHDFSKILAGSPLVSKREL